MRSPYVPGDAHDVVARRVLPTGAAASVGAASAAEPRATLLAHRLALVAIEHRAHVRQRVVGDVDQVAIARLTKHVAPVVAVGPELRVLEREIDAPQHRDAEEVAVADDRRDDDHAVHEQVRRELLAGT